MLLLDTEQPINHSVRKVAVVSDNPKIQKEVSELLRARGVEYVDIINAPFYSEEVSLDSCETVGVIIDIHDDDNVSRISERVNSIVPQNIWCCLVGDSDSISLAQRLAERDILYFNTNYQLNNLMDRIIYNTVSIPKTRRTVRLNVLSCKGGIGASFICAQLAHNIGLHKRVPTLMAQSRLGTQDLDLMFDKKLQGDVLELLPNLDLYMGDFEDLPPADLERYNFIVNDYPIYHTHKSQYPELIDKANTFILVVERTVNSLRIAKRFLDDCDRARSKLNKPLRTFVVISDINVEHSRSMSVSDVQDLLGCDVDAVIPHIAKTTAKSVLAIKLSRLEKKAFRILSMKAIGVISRQEKSKISFSNIFKKLLLGK